MSKLKEIAALCQGGVFVTVNEHRNYYHSVAQHLADRGDTPDISSEVQAKMIELDTLVELQFYPRTPVGFYRIWHYDLDAALDEALALLHN